MTTTITPTPTEQQIADYHEDGYLIVRNVLSPKEADANFDASSKKR